MKVEIGQQRTDDRALWRARLRCPLGQTIQNILFKKALDQFQQPSIGNIPLNVLHQSAMWYAVKVGFQVGVHNVGVAGFQLLFDFPQGILAASVRSESITGRSKLPLKNRFDNQPDGRLCYTIPDCGNTQRSLLPASGLIDVSPFDRTRLIGRRTQLFAQFVNVFFQFLFKPFYVFMIRPGTAAVSLNGLPGSIQGFRSVNFINQTEPNFSFHPLVEGFQHAICPHRAFHPVHCLGFSRLFSPAGHFHGFVFVLYRHLASTFLRPFAPQPLRRFFATMDALTPVRRVLRILIRDNERPSLTGQVSPVHPTRPSKHPVTKHPTRPVIASSLLNQRGRFPVSLKSGLDFALYPQARRYVRPNRVRHPTGCSFASGCSPPRFTTTQLPSAIGGEHPP